MNQYVGKRPGAACFRRWANKSYAVFNSLHRCVKIGVLLVGYTMLTSPERGHAQTDTDRVKIVDLEEVEVSADASPDVFAPAGRVITQLKKTEIEHAAVQSLTDILEFVPGVDLRQRGPFGTQADVSIRGSSFDQTLILLNGINLSDPQTGHYSLNLPIDLESVEKIEILEGPAARIFGNNALGGTVNFITGTRSENRLNVALSGGQHGFYKASITGSLHTKRTDHHLAVSRTASDGYMPCTDFKNANVFLQNKWNNRLIPIDLQLGYSQKDYGANGFYGPKYPDQYESLHTFFTALKGEITGKVNISPTLYWRRNYDHYILNRNNPEAYQNFHYTDVYGADVTASFRSRFGKTTFGVLMRSERIYSSNLGADMDTPREVPRNDGKYYTKTDQRSNVGVFAEQNLYAGNWSASVGLSVNRNSHTNSKLNFHPGVDLAYRIAESIKLYASANRAMRLPTFTDLYYQSPVNRGNPDLKPEYCTEYESGVKVSTNGRNARVGYFYRHTSDAIDWIWKEDVQKWHTLNMTELYTQGISADAQFDFRQLIDSDFRIHAVSASYSFIHSNKSSEQYSSFYALDYLRHKIDTGLTHRISGKINAHWNIGFRDRNGGYLAYDAETGAETETPYDAFWQADLRIYRQTERMNIFAEASNIGNKQHRDIGNITLPGIWVRAGVAITLKR